MALGLNEGPFLYDLALTRLRTFNGSALVERCHRAWRNQQPIRLEYRGEDGLISAKPIVAARTISSQEGQVIMLWVRLPESDIEIELEYDDDDDDETDEDTPPDDLA